MRRRSPPCRSQQLPLLMGRPHLLQHFTSIRRRGFAVSPNPPRVRMIRTGHTTLRRLVERCIDPGSDRLCPSSPRAASESRRGRKRRALGHKWVDCVFERTQVDQPFVLTAGQCGFVDDPAGDVRESVLVELDSTLPGLFPVGDEQILDAEQESAAERTRSSRPSFMSCLNCTTRTFPGLAGLRLVTPAKTWRGHARSPGLPSRP